MRMRARTGFTLVEILIVVVILGILAAIVVPQFTQASSEAIKGALQSQLQTINSQVELYRVREQGALPTDDADSAMGGADNNGWGVRVGNEYLKDEPVNGYTGCSVVDSQAAADAGEPHATADSGRDTAQGWGYVASGNQLTVFAVGYNENTNELAHEVEAEEEE